jgi:hypothetical protein
MQEQYAGPNDGERVIAIQTNYTNKIQPSTVSSEFEQLISRGYPGNWSTNVGHWENNFTEMADRLDTDGPIKLEANSTLVNQDECLQCVYRDLCAVPDSGVNLE